MLKLLTAYQFQKFKHKLAWILACFSMKVFHFLLTESAEQIKATRSTHEETQWKNVWLQRITISYPA